MRHNNISRCTRRLLRLAVIAVTIYGVIANAAILATLLAPLYTLSGPIQGYVGVVSYRIVAFGKEYLSPALDLASFLSIIVITSSTLNIAAGIATFYLITKVNKLSVTTLEALTASALTLLVSLGTLYAIRRIIDYELTHLTSSFSYDSTAGRVLIERVSLHPLPASVMLQGLNYAFITVPYVVAAIIVYVRTLKNVLMEQQEPVGGKSEC